MPPFHLASSQSTLLIDEFEPTISAPDLTMGADALHAFRRHFGLLLGNEIHQGLAYSGIHEDPLAMLADEGPTRHASILATCEGEKNTHLGVFFARGELVTYGYFFFIASGLA